MLLLSVCVVCVVHDFSLKVCSPTIGDISITYYQGQLFPLGKSVTVTLSRAFYHRGWVEPGPLEQAAQRHLAESGGAERFQGGGRATGA